MKVTLTPALSLFRARELGHKEDVLEGLVADMLGRSFTSVRSS
jgi:hypothetical protein